MSKAKFTTLETVGVGAVAYAVGMVVLPFGMIIDAAAMLVVAPAIALNAPTLLTWATSKGSKKAIATIVETDPNDRIAAATIATAKSKLDTIESVATSIRAPNTIRQIKKLVATGHKIIDDIQQDHKDALLVQSWANSYLDETLNLVKGYAALSRQGTTSIEAQRQMAKFDAMLDSLENQFNDLLKRCVENDVMDFDITMSVMNTRLNQEGM